MGDDRREAHIPALYGLMMSCMQIDLLLTAATFCASIISVVTGIFGMNLNNTHEDSYPAFITVSPAILHPLWESFPCLLESSKVDYFHNAANAEWAPRILP